MLQTLRFPIPKIQSSNFNENSMKINFDWFVLNEIGSGNSNFVVPTLQTSNKFNCQLNFDFYALVFLKLWRQQYDDTQIAAYFTWTGPAHACFMCARRGQFRLGQLQALHGEPQKLNT